MSTKPLSRLALPAAALGLFGFAVATSIHPPRTIAAPPASPPIADYAGAVAGVGIVEPESELIKVAPEISGVIRAVLVRAGQRVSKNQALVRLDDRAARAALESARAQEYAAQVVLEDEKQRLSLFNAVTDQRAISMDEKARREFAVKRADAALMAARAEKQRRAIDLELLTISAPIDGRVFRVNARPGEFTAAGDIGSSVVEMGADRLLHVRAEIDEADSGRLNEEAKAYGLLRGQENSKIPLQFVRTEPQAVDKRALSGGSERVDTRVIEILYAFDPKLNPSFLGQRMDVFIEAGDNSTAPKVDLKK